MDLRWPGHLLQGQLLHGRGRHVLGFDAVIHLPKQALPVSFAYVSLTCLPATLIPTCVVVWSPAAHTLTSFTAPVVLGLLAYEFRLFHFL